MVTKKSQGDQLRGYHSDGLLASRQSILIAGGAESQTNPYEFPFPYAFAASGEVHSAMDDLLAFENQWIVEAHVINTQSMSSGKQSQCASCPCTLEDRKANSMINGEVVHEGVCNSQLEHENNTACAFETYLGGVHCCVEGEFCLEREALAIQPEKGSTIESNAEPPAPLVEDGTAAKSSIAATAAPGAPISSFYLQYTVEYAPAVIANRWLYVATCCDASGDLSRSGNLEYDVPACGPKEERARCVHNLTTYQRVDSGDLGNPVWDQKRAQMTPKPLKPTTNSSKSATSSSPPAPTISSGIDPGREVDLVFAVGHQHHSGLGIRIYRNTTSELLCDSVPQNSSDASGGQNGSGLVGLQACVFDPPLRLRASDVLRIEALYNSSEARIGVQSLVYLAIHDVDRKDKQQQEQQLLVEEEEMDTESKFRSAEADVVGDLNDLLELMGFVVSVVAVLSLLVAGLKQQQRRSISAQINDKSANIGRCSTAETNGSIDTSESPLVSSTPR
ncbi:hypothetical protein Gpo141_00004794 [Globisporangium polare]